MNLEFIDVNCMFGSTTGASLHIKRPDELVQVMDKNNIRKAVIYSSLCIKNSLIQGNDETAGLAGKNDRFIGSMVLVPTLYNENGTLEMISKTIRDSNIRFTRMFPRTHNFKFSKWQIGDILDMLQNKKIPVMMNLDEIDIGDFVETKKEFPAIPVVIACTTQWANRIYPALCKELPNVYIETSNTIEYRGIEFLSRLLGPDKLIFGTNMPKKEPYDSIYHLVYSDIPDSEKEMIACGNINRILNEIRI